MKFIVSSSTLNKQLQVIGGTLNSVNTLPILDNFLFEIHKDELIASASDLETTMSTHIKLDKVEKEGNVAIPARLLLDTLKTFADQPLTFTVDDKTHSVEIASDNGKYKLAGASAEEFPKVPEIEAPSSIELDADSLYCAIEKTLFASGNDELRPVMSGILMELSTDDITFVATDAHKLVRYRRLDIKADKSASFIVPKKPMNLLRAILPETESKVKIEYNENNALFSLDGISLTCRLIEGKYPDYNAVIPKENPNVLTIGTKELLNSIKRVSIFANQTTHQVKLKIKGSELNISAEDPDFANEATERLTCQYDGDDIEIGFNSRFLAEMLSNIDSENIYLKMSEPNRAGILVPVDSGDDQEDVLMLVMPVMLNA